MGQIAYAEWDGVGVEAPLGKREALGVSLHEGEPLLLGRPFATDRQHLRADVADHRPRPGPGRSEEAGGDVPGAACDVEKGEGGRALWRGKPGDQVVFP